MSRSPLTQRMGLFATLSLLLSACSMPESQTFYPAQPNDIPTPPPSSQHDELAGVTYCWSDSLGSYSVAKSQCKPGYETISARAFRERREAKALTAFFDAHPDAANENFLADRFEMVATGTAFFVTEDGYLITNKHVVQDCDLMTLVASDAFHSVVVIDTDDRDLALLKAPLHVDRYALFTTWELRVGENVYAIGYPMLGYLGGLIVTDGIVSSLYGPPDSPQYIQISAPIQPGNSGGPLFDQYGTIAGVVTAKDFEVGDTTLEGVGYAIRPRLVGGFMLANGLDPLLLAYKELPTPSIVEYASAFTVPVACWVKKK
jgi:S1-C subfamily serine protease